MFRISHKTGLSIKEDQRIQEHNLAKQVAKGDQTAFLELYQSYKARVFNTSLSYVQNHEDAEEITQDVFVEIHRSIHKFKGESKLKTWIYRITVNKSLDFTRKKKSLKRSALVFSLPDRETLHQSESVVFKHPGIILENQENAQILFQAIDLLPDKQKMAFVLSYIENLPRQEIAQAMSSSLKAIESLLQRAKKNLRKTLDKFYPERRHNKK